MLATKTFAGIWQSYDPGDAEAERAEQAHVITVVEQWAKRTGLPFCCVYIMDKSSEYGIEPRLALGLLVARATNADGTVSIETAVALERLSPAGRRPVLVLEGGTKTGGYTHEEVEGESFQLRLCASRSPRWSDL